MKSNKVMTSQNYYTLLNLLNYRIVDYRDILKDHNVKCYNSKNQTFDKVPFLYHQIALIDLRAATRKTKVGDFFSCVLHPVKFEFSLFWMLSQCVACSLAGYFLYHVTVSCKGPIAIKRIFICINVSIDSFLPLKIKVLIR